jgi:hypothetical protein
MYNERLKLIVQRYQFKHTVVKTRLSNMTYGMTFRKDRGGGAQGYLLFSKLLEIFSVVKNLS